MQSFRLDRERILRTDSRTRGARPRDGVPGSPRIPSPIKGMRFAAVSPALEENICCQFLCTFPPPDPADESAQSESSIFRWIQQFQHVLGMKAEICVARAKEKKKKY